MMSDYMLNQSVPEIMRRAIDADMSNRSLYDLALGEMKRMQDDANDRLAALQSRIDELEAQLTVLTTLRPMDELLSKVLHEDTPYLMFFKDHPQYGTQPLVMYHNWRGDLIDGTDNYYSTRGGLVQAMGSEIFGWLPLPEIEGGNG